MKDKLELFLLLLIELAMLTIITFVMTSLLAIWEIIPAIITIIPGLIYVWEMIETFELLIDSFKQDREDNND
jgi:hypothetical protein